MEVPSPEAVASMSPEDVRSVLTRCPESPYLMHNQLDIDDEQARDMAFQLAIRWHVRKVKKRHNLLLKPHKSQLEPILEKQEEVK